MGQPSLIVAVVDDDVAVRDALKFALEFDGLTVRLYDSARALLEGPGLADHDCFVIDYRMPAIDGLELVDILREHGLTAPVIIITARANSGLIERARRAGIDTVLEKPLSDDRLADSIRAALRRRRPIAAPAPC